MRNLPRSLRGLIGDENGGMTVLGLYMGAGAMMVGGLAVDVGNLMATRTQLQVAADFTAHAALYTREHESAADAKTKAIALAKKSFSDLVFGDYLTADNIKFGTYDKATQVFTVDETSKEAVYVQAERLTAKANPVASYLMQFVGFGQWDVISPSVFETYVPWCLRDGWVAEGVVDSQSNNIFKDGFCIHSNDHVEVNNNGLYESGVVVSMPDKSTVIYPLPDGLISNVGLADALTDDYMNLRILNQLEWIQKGLYDTQSDHFRSYISDITPIQLSGGTYAGADFTQKNRIYKITCGKGKSKTLTLNLADTLSDVVIDTDCVIKFGNASILINSVIFTTSTDEKSITAPNGLQLGADDHCDPANGAQIVTYGGFEVASGLQIYSSQVIAKGPIQFAAQADGVEGGSFISGKTIDGTSNTQMSHCANGMEEIFMVDLFRMAG